MIVSASYRTDIPAFHSQWFAERLAAGYAMVRNPYGSKDYRVDLSPEATSGFVFWTRNARPFLPQLDHLAETGRPFYLQYTVTNYPDTLEWSVPPAAHGIEVIRHLSRQFGPRAVIWRYDPIVLTEQTDRTWHRQNLTMLAGQLAGLVDECVFSVMHPYQKTRRNFSWYNAPELIDGAEQLLPELAEIIAGRGMQPTLCSQPDFLQPPMAPAACVDADRLSDVAGHPVTARKKGNRPGCACAESRDIGRYDTCAHGCLYCYAVRDPLAAREAVAAADPQSEKL